MHSVTARLKLVDFDVVLHIPGSLAGSEKIVTVFQCWDKLWSEHTLNTYQTRLWQRQWGHSLRQDIRAERQCHIQAKTSNKLNISASEKTEIVSQLAEDTCHIPETPLMRVHPCQYKAGTITCKTCSQVGKELDIRADGQTACLKIARADPVTQSHRHLNCWFRHN
jgi:hypothetical protein